MRGGFLSLPSSGDDRNCGTYGNNRPSTTGTMSLGKAIHSLYPQANASAESKKGTDEAKPDLKGSGVKVAALFSLV